MNSCSPRRHLLRTSTAALFLPLLCGLAACAPAALPVDAAAATYDAAVSDVAAALELEQRSSDDEPALQPGDDGCVYHPASIELDAPQGTDLRGSAGQLAPVLAEHGFEEPEPYDAPGGWSGLRSQDEHGASLTVLRKTDIAVVALEAPVDPGDSACEDASLP